MRGQVALEYMMIVALVLLIITPLAAYTWSQNSQASTSRQAEIAVGSIAAAADSVWSQGPGAKTTIQILFPNGYVASNSSIGNRMIVLRYTAKGGASDAVAITKANISGTVPSSSGYKVATLEVIGSYVNVSFSGG